jgi:hypothetical protein
MPGGRPTLYRKEFCKYLVKHLGAGHSYDTFPAFLYKEKLLGVIINQDTLYAWEKNNKEYSESKSLGRRLQKLFWEKLIIKACQDKYGKNRAQSLIIFTMKNMCGWRDTPLDLDQMSDRQLLELVEKAKEALERKNEQAE